MSRHRNGSLPRICATIILALGLTLGVMPPSSAAPTTAPTGLISTGTTIPMLSCNRMPGATDYQVQGSDSDSFSSLAFEATTHNATYVPTRMFKWPALLACARE